LKCFVRLLESICQAGGIFWMAFMFQGHSSVSWSWTFRVTKRQQSYRKCLKNSRTHPWRPSPNNPWARRHLWGQRCNLPRDLSKTFELTPASRQCTSTHIPENHRVCD
jgi:hypothetical protein